MELLEQDLMCCCDPTTSIKAVTGKTNYLLSNRTSKTSDTLRHFIMPTNINKCYYCNQPVTTSTANRKLYRETSKQQHYT